MIGTRQRRETGQELMWRLRFFLEKVGWKSVAIGAVVVVAVAAGVVSLALIRGGDDSSAATTAAPEESTNVFYLRALAPTTRVSGCQMFITFTWRPDFQADQYIDAPALITASGTGIQGTYRKRFTPRGVSIELGPVAITGGYQLWSARVTALDQDPPGNDTTVTAGAPPDNNCGTG
jgi:hypothetical protein